MPILLGYDITDKFIEHENLIQQTANAKSLNKEMFLALYKDPPILYDNNEEHPEFYNRGQKPKENKPRIDVIVNWIKDNPSYSVVSVGCGKEIKTLKALRDMGFTKLTGLDILDPSMIDEHNGIAYIQQPNKPEKHDVLICMETLEHISTNNTMQFWQDLYNLFDKEILLTIPHSPSLENFMIRCPICNRWATQSGHVRYYPPSVVEAEALVNGIKIVEKIRYHQDSWAYRGVKL